MQTFFTDQTSVPKTRHSQKVRKEANLNAIVENFDGYVWSIDTNLEYIIINTALRNKIQEISGVDVKPGDKVMDILEMIDASKTKAWSKVYQEGFEGKPQRFVAEFSIAGRTAFCDVSVNPIREGETISGLSCFCRDITEEIMNDRRLKASEVRFRALIENSTDITVVLNNEGKIIYGSPSIEKYFGITSGDYTDASFLEFIHPEDMAELTEKFLDLLMNPGKEVAVTTRARTPDGRQIWTEGIVSNLLNTEGINGIVCNFRDITERVTASSEREKAEKIIKENEDLYRNLFNNSPLPIWVCDASTLRFLEVNEAAIRHYGYSRKEFLKMTAFGLVPMHEHEELKRVLSIDTNMRLQRNHIKRNGEQIFVEVLVHHINYKGQRSYMVLANDITEKIRLQNQLIEEKLHRHQEIFKATIEATEKERESIGRELHDNVTQILTTARLCLSCISDNHPSRDMIDRSSNTITSAIEEIRGLSKSMIQSFHREIGLKLSIEDLVESIRVANKFQVSLDFYLPDEQLLDDKLKMTLFRIIQEQLNNILKHAEATEIAISIQQYDEVLNLVIADNGKGFNVHEKRKGIGITNITNRAELFNGLVKIVSAPGKGCRMEVGFGVR
jgi:PAS domain S-box-containing protein